MFKAAWLCQSLAGEQCQCHSCTGLRLHRALATRCVHQRVGILRLFSAPGPAWRLHTASAKGPPNWDCQMGKMAARASTTGPLLSSLRAVRCTSPAAPPATACSACKRPKGQGFGTMCNLKGSVWAGHVWHILPDHPAQWFDGGMDRPGSAPGLHHTSNAIHNKSC